ASRRRVVGGRRSARGPRGLQAGLGRFDLLQDGDQSLALLGRDAALVYHLPHPVDIAHSIEPLSLMVARCSRLLLFVRFWSRTRRGLLAATTGGLLLCRCVVLARGRAQAADSELVALQGRGVDRARLAVDALGYL